MSSTEAASGQRGVRLAGAAGRWVLLATVLGLAIASIYATVAGMALLAIGRGFGVGLPAVQCVVTAYCGGSAARRSCCHAGSNRDL
jgi:hypothetical protein